MAGEARARGGDRREEGVALAPVVLPLEPSLGNGFGLGLCIASELGTLDRLGGGGVREEADEADENGGGEGREGVPAGVGKRQGVEDDPEAAPGEATTAAAAAAAAAEVDA